MKKVCEAELQEDLKNHGDLVYVLDADVLWLEDISKQYGIRIDGLAEARKKVNQMKVKERQKSSASSSRKSSSYGTSSSKKSTSSNSYRPSSSSRDFDQYDIEAYYEDNRDEYDDYEDAYEGSDDVEPIANPTLTEAENTKLREWCSELLQMAESHDPEWLHWPELHDELRKLGIEVDG